MANSTIYPLNFKPGIKRDNTIFNDSYYVDGKWNRFYRGKPKKMGGYRSIYDQYEEIIRGECLSFQQEGVNYVFGGSASQIQMLEVNADGKPGTISDRTPSGFSTDSTYEWKMTSIYNSAGTEMVVVAMATPTVEDIASTTDMDIYYGMITASDALTTLSFQVSGGIVALPPYLFAYGNDGYLAWSDANNILQIGEGGSGDAGAARICANKVVKGMPIRSGPNNSPSGLFWSLDTLQLVSYVGGDLIFANSTLASDISILSTNAVIDYDGVIYWPGVDRFLMYNGVVREVQNDLNLDFFYQNYNKNYPQKIYAVKDPRWGEIWWCFPFGNSTETNWAIVYNVREGTWYDTPLPEGGRSAGISAKSTFPYPMLFGNQMNSIDRYNLWQHEFGVDKIIGSQALAIEAFFETGDISYMAQGPLNQGWVGKNKWTRCLRIEPDFVQSGDLDITLTGQPFAMAPDGTSATYVYDGTNKFKVDTRKQYRQLRMKVRSNTQGGDYYAGQTTVELAEGDVRAASGSTT